MALDITSQAARAWPRSWFWFLRREYVAFSSQNRAKTWTELTATQRRGVQGVRGARVRHVRYLGGITASPDQDRRRQTARVKVVPNGKLPITGAEGKAQEH